MLARRRKKPLSEINVVPYIDVMLVLLVIFMITAPLLTQGIQVNLPQASATSLPADKDMPIVVSVDQRGLYYLNVAKHPKQPLNATATDDAGCSTPCDCQASAQARSRLCKGGSQ